MKNNKHIIIALLTGIALSFTLSSCQKGFDAKTYAPTKPPPNFGGFNNSKDIEPESRVAYWPFNDSLTDSISQATGVASGTSFTTGISGKGLQGAANSYALCDTPPALAKLTSLTVSLWVNTPPPSTGTIGLFSLANTATFWGNIEIFFENGSDNINGRVRVHLSQDGNDYTYSVDGVAGLFNSWANLTVSYDETSGQCSLYVNGAPVNNGKAGNLTGPLAFTNVGKVVFGTSQFMTNPSQTSATTAQGWASYLTGKLDQVRIYDKVLSSGEVSALYNLDKLGR